MTAKKFEKIEHHCSNSFINAFLIVLTKKTERLNFDEFLELLNWVQGSGVGSLANVGRFRFFKASFAAPS